jgi:hypothetical protein
MTVKEFFESSEIKEKTIVLRIDVDFDPLRAGILGDILKEHGIRGSFYFRLHGKYNLFAFPVVNIVQRLLKDGHELGVHSEMIDMEKICHYDPGTLLSNDVAMVEMFYATTIYGTASHGDHTGYNNLDFWKNHVPKDYGLLYEAYDEGLFKRGYYLSDSLVSQWKLYDKGVLVKDFRLDPLSFVQSEFINFLYFLIHPDSFYREHYHENICY